MGQPEILTATIAALPVAAMVISRTGAVLAANAAAARALGFANDSHAALDAPPSDALRAICAAVADARRRGRLPEPFDSVDATGGTVTIRFAPICLGDLGALLVVEERGEVNALTAQVRRLEEELRASRTDMDTANAELMAANEQLHSANHELQARLS